MQERKKSRDLESELLALQRRLALEDSLERLRDSAIAMQKSDDLSSIVGQTLSELKLAAIPIDVILVEQIEKDTNEFSIWPATAQKTFGKINLRTDENKDLIDSIKRTLLKIENGDSIIDIYSKEDTIFHNYLKNLTFDELINIPAAETLDKASLILSCTCSRSVNTALYVGNLRGHTYVQSDMMTIRRVAKVVDQIFSRYLSLFRIEERAREAKIEAMLERIRIRSIEMVDTTELQDIVNLVSKQLQEIKIAINGGVFISINDEVDNHSGVPIWGSGGATEYVQKADIPFLDKPIFQNLSNAIRNRSGFITEEYSREEKEEFFRHLFDHEPWINAPVSFKGKLLTLQGGYTRSASILANTTIFMINNEGGVFSEKDNEILRQFSAVFEQSYIRFLDLRKAEKQAAELIRLTQAKDRLYTNITHEFRTPLTIISGITNQIQEDPEAWLEKGIPMIQRNSNRLMKLVNQVLDLSKLESGKQHLTYRYSDIIVYLKTVTDSVQNLAHQKEIQLLFKPNEKEVFMDFDTVAIRQVVANLISNSIKYSNVGSTICIEASIIQVNSNHTSQSELLRLVVRDEGEGIAPRDLPFIFDRFYQVNDTHTRKDGSSGIGLAIVKELVVLMNGEISVKSTLGEGSAFTVLLPIKADSSALTVGEPALSKLPSVEKSLPHESITATENANVDHQLPLVLIIEDNADIASYIQGCVADAYSSEWMDNGESGIAYAIEHIPDLIILDVMMPKMDGYEVCQQLKRDERTSHIPIVIVTAKADIESKRAGLQHGADAYLYKPFDKTELLIRLEQLLELRRRLQAHYRKPRGRIEVEPSLEDRFMQRLDALIEENIALNTFGVNDLCAALRLSQSQVLRKLKALTNTSISTYIRNARLERAKTLLLEGDYSVSEVAYFVGFKDPLYFSRAFSSQFGIPPSSYTSR